MATPVLSTQRRTDVEDDLGGARPGSRLTPRPLPTGCAGRRAGKAGSRGRESPSKRFLVMRGTSDWCTLLGFVRPLLPGFEPLAGVPGHADRHSLQAARPVVAGQAAAPALGLLWAGSLFAADGLLPRAFCHQCTPALVWLQAASALLAIGAAYVAISGTLTYLVYRTHLEQVVTSLVSNAVAYGAGKPIDLDGLLNMVRRHC